MFAVSSFFIGALFSSLLILIILSVFDLTLLFLISVVAATGLVFLFRLRFFGFLFLGFFVNSIYFFVFSYEASLPSRKYDRNNATMRLIASAVKNLDFNKERCVLKELTKYVDKRLLIDSYNGQSYRMLWNGHTCLLYSISPDKVDSQGEILLDPEGLIYHPDSAMWKLPLLQIYFSGLDYFARFWEGDLIIQLGTEDSSS